MTAEDSVERKNTPSLTDLVNHTAQRVIDSGKEHVLQLPIKPSDISEPPTERGYAYWEQKVKPLLPPLQPGEKRSGYLHRQLCEAIIGILNRNPNYRDELVLILTEEYEPDPRLLPPKGDGVIVHVSTFKGIRLARKDKASIPRWVKTYNPAGILSWTETIRDEQKWTKAAQGVRF